MNQLATIDLVVIISLTVLAVCFFILLFFLIPLIIQVQRILARVDDITQVFQKKFIPHISKVSDLIDSAESISKNTKKFFTNNFTFAKEILVTLANNSKK